MFDQLRDPKTIQAKSDLIMLTSNVLQRVPIAASADRARDMCQHSFLMLLVLLVVLILSWTPVKAASASDRTFMRYEIQASAYELEFGRLGLARALRPEIRAYAETVVNDHARYNEALRDLARSKDVSLPPTMNQRDRQRLDRLGSIHDSTFDAAFLREARRINGDGIRAFRLEAIRTVDPEVRAFVLRFLEVDKKHQSVARSMNDIVVASRAVVIHPPRTGDPIVVVPAPDTSRMPVLRPPSDLPHETPGRD